MNFKVISSEIKHRGRVFDLKIDSIEYDSGNKGIREVALHNGGSVIVPVTKNGKLLLVRQFRYPFNKYMIEFPAGKLEIGEDPFVCAQRELEEETGYKSNNIIKLGAICTTPGFCTEVLHIYLAKDLTEGQLNREEGEYGMEIIEADKNEIAAKIISGEILDAKTICAFQYFNLQ